MIIDDEKKIQKGCEDVLKAPEICVWMTAFGGMRTLAEIRKDWLVGGMTKADFYRQYSHTLISLAETADATHRFGVLLPCTVENPKKKELSERVIKIEFGVSFWRWFNWWDDFLKTKTTAEIKRIYSLAMDRLPEIENFRPAGDWLEYRTNPAFSLVTSLSS